jgi:protein-tyrosine-phosphatase
MAKRGDKSVLFLCTGNYYRSRFAEVLFSPLCAHCLEAPCLFIYGCYW